jgi:hypothetical protein
LLFQIPERCLVSGIILCMLVSCLVDGETSEVFRPLFENAIAQQFQVLIKELRDEYDDGWLALSKRMI